MAVLFSAVTITSDSDQAEFLVAGVPKSYADLEGWTAFESFMDEVDTEQDISGRVNPYMWEEGVGKAYWYTPVTASDKALIADTVLDYVGMYQSEGMAMSL